jgi:hypothetical protein
MIQGFFNFIESTATAVEDTIIVTIYKRAIKLTGS